MNGESGVQSNSLIPSYMQRSCALHGVNKHDRQSTKTRGIKSWRLFISRFCVGTKIFEFSSKLKERSALCKLGLVVAVCESGVGRLRFRWSNKKYSSLSFAAQSQYSHSSRRSLRRENCRYVHTVRLHLHTNLATIELTFTYQFSHYRAIIRSFSWYYS